MYDLFGARGHSVGVAQNRNVWFFDSLPAYTRTWSIPGVFETREGDDYCPKHVVNAYLSLVIFSEVD